MTLWIQYSAAVDFLTLWNGVQSGGGEDVKAGLTVFFDNMDLRLFLLPLRVQSEN